MGVIKVKVPDNVEEAFRKLAMRRFGYRKGAMSEAAKEAMGQWSISNKENVKNPFAKLRGILKHVKKSSVELQHDAWEGVARKYARRR